MEKTEIKYPVFVVDDEDEIAKILVVFLQEIGASVFSYNDAQSALNDLNQKNPFLIISDFKMPGMDGYEFCTQIRKKYIDTPFVLLTAFADKKLAIEGLKIGVSEILEKPVNIEHISDVYNKYAKLRIEKDKIEAEELEEIVDLFVEEVDGLFADLESLIMRLEDEPLEELVIDSLFRKIHSVKGTAKAIPSAALMANLSHDFESALALIKSGKARPNSSWIDVFLTASDFYQKLLDDLRHRRESTLEIKSRVKICIEDLKTLQSSVSTSDAGVKKGSDVAKEVTLKEKAPAGMPNITEKLNSKDEGLWIGNEKMDSFMQSCGELIALKNICEVIAIDSAEVKNSERVSQRLSDFVISLDKLTDDFQGQIMSIRKVTLEKTFSKLPRMVRQLSNQLGRDIDFKMEGLNFGVDKNISAILSSAMTHMVRNSIDHGIENSDLRAERGKSPKGMVSLRTEESQGVVNIYLEDDGGGINRDAILRKAQTMNLLPSEEEAFQKTAQKMSDSEVFLFLFKAGFSTAKYVTDVSGRGVGMDAVRSSIESLNGKIHIQSTAGKGTSFHLEIPVLKTIMVEDSIITSSDGALLVISLDSVSKITTASELQIREVNHISTCQYMGLTVPMLSYRQLVSRKRVADIPCGDNVVLMQHKGTYVALVVDSIEGQIEAVVRPFDQIIKKIRGFAGTTILRDDKIAYVISQEDMIEMFLDMEMSRGVQPIAA